jgi:hypothetical protein
VVFGKALRILGQAELFEPIRNLLHGGTPDLTLFVLDRENRKSTTRRNILQRPHKGHMSEEGQTQKSWRVKGKSALPSRTDMVSRACQV